MAIKIEPTGKALGGLITGIDLSENVSSEDQEVIFSWWIKHMVLVFRNQTLQFEDLLRLRHIFGPAGKTANQLLGLGRKTYYQYEVPDDITIISNITDADGHPKGSLGNGEAFWHTDSSFTEEPISASLLHAVEVSDQGGQTSFLNMYMAYETLPEELRKVVDGAYSNHSKTHSSDGTPRQSYGEITDVSKAPGIRHPLVRLHPVTRKKCLFLGRRLNSFIFDYTVKESEELLDKIWSHSCDPKFIWEHEWAVGDLLVWDNRCTMHHRKPFPAHEKRLMHKSMTAGETVIPG
mgnify:FL=1